MRFTRARPTTRLAGALAALLLLAPGCTREKAGEAQPQAVERAQAAAAAAPDIDGPWNAVTIDGQAVPPREWRIGVEGGKVSGGRDGCNDWGYGEPEVKGGARTIVSTLVGCPEGDPVRKAYWAMAMAPEARLELLADGTLRIAARGHEAVLRRCRWVSEPLPPGVQGRGRRVCAEG
jgi:hypothetical protein